MHFDALFARPLPGLMPELWTGTLCSDSGQQNESGGRSVRPRHLAGSECVGHRIPSVSPVTHPPLRPPRSLSRPTTEAGMPWRGHMMTKPAPMGAPHMVFSADVWLCGRRIHSVSAELLLRVTFGVAGIPSFGVEALAVPHHIPPTPFLRGRPHMCSFPYA